MEIILASIITGLAGWFMSSIGYGPKTPEFYLVGGSLVTVLILIIAFITTRRRPK